MSLPAEKLFDITDLARSADVSTRTIRYYEELGLIRPAARGAGRRRLYDADALRRLGFIGRLKTLGLTLEEIGSLNRAFDSGSTPALLDKLERLLDRHVEEIGSRIAELERLATELKDYRQRIAAKRKKGS